MWGVGGDKRPGLDAVRVETMLNKEGSIQPYDTMSPWIDCHLQFIYLLRILLDGGAYLYLSPADCSLMHDMESNPLQFVVVAPLPLRLGQIETYGVSMCFYVQSYDGPRLPLTYGMHITNISWKWK